MPDTLDEQTFTQMFKGRAIVLTDLSPGRARGLAEQVNETVGHGDATLRTTAEYRALFTEPMYVVDIRGWPQDNLKPATPAVAPAFARLRVWRTDPRDTRHVPPEGPTGTLFTSATFSLANSGNRTANAPKRSWKINVDPGDDEDLVAGMARLNLKAMWNDPSQMREAIAGDLFADVGVPASRHTFA